MHVRPSLNSWERVFQRQYRSPTTLRRQKPMEQSTATPSGSCGTELTRNFFDPEKGCAEAISSEEGAEITRETVSPVLETEQGSLFRPQASVRTRSNYSPRPARRTATKSGGPGRGSSQFPTY